MEKMILSEVVFADYGVKGVHGMLNQWERILERADEHVRRKESETWHQKDEGKSSHAIDDAHSKIKVCIYNLLHDETTCNFGGRLEYYQELPEIYAKDFFKRYYGFSSPDDIEISIANGLYPKYDDNTAEVIAYDSITKKPFFPMVKPEDFRRFAAAQSADELEDDETFLSLVEELSKVDMFRQYNFIRLSEEDDRQALSSDIYRLLRLAAVKAKSIDRYDIAERLVVDAEKASHLNYERDGEKRVKLINEIIASMVDDLNALGRAIVVSELPTWETVKRANDGTEEDAEEEV